MSTTPILPTTEGGRGRRPHTRVRVEILDQLMLAHGASSCVEGWTPAQLGRIVSTLVGSSARTVQRHLRALESDGYVEEIPGTGGSFRLTQQGELAHARARSMDSHRKQA